jgi:glutamate carboxypeptidase
MTIPAYMAARKHSMIAVLKGLVLRESPTEAKSAVDACTRHFLGLMTGLRRDVLRIPQDEIGDLYAVGFPRLTLGADRPILVLAHSDTVWPLGTASRRPWRLAGRKAYGPGALDMKAGLVISLFAFRALAELKRHACRPAVLFINSAEETGHPSSSRWITRFARRAACVLCLEPCLPGGALKVRRKGRLVVRLTSRGVSAHAGAPERGVSAVEELLHQLDFLRSLRTGGTTMNVGLIQGGTKANVVPDRAAAILDFRFWTRREEARILRRLKAVAPGIPGARVSCAVESRVPPLEPNRGSRALFSRAARVAGRLGLTLRSGQTGGGSDASLAASLGLPTLDGLGPDGDGLHAENEHVLVPSMVERAGLLAELLAEL